MSEPISSASSHEPLSYATHGLLEPQNALVRLGGALGIAAASLGLMIFFMACAGFEAAFHGYPILPLIFCNVCAWMIYRAFIYMHERLQLTPVFVCFAVLVLLGLPIYWLSTKIGYRDASEEGA